MLAVLCVSNEWSDHSVQQAERQQIDFADKLSRAQNDAGMVSGYCENFARRHGKDSVEHLLQLLSFLFSEIHRNDIFFVIIYLAE
jgi:hypothetical protein